MNPTKPQDDFVPDTEDFLYSLEIVTEAGAVAPPAGAGSSSSTGRLGKDELRATGKMGIAGPLHMPGRGARIALTVRLHL